MAKTRIVAKFMEQTKIRSSSSSTYCSVRENRNLERKQHANNVRLTV